MFDVCETPIEVAIEGGQLVDPAVQRLLGLTQDLTQEERRERDVHHDALGCNNLCFKLHNLVVCGTLVFIDKRLYSQ